MRRVAGGIPLDVTVDRNICMACCQQESNDQPINSVVASQLFGAASRFLEHPDCSGRKRHDTQLLKSYAEQRIYAVDGAGIRMHTGAGTGVTASSPRRRLVRMVQRFTRRKPQIGLIGCNIPTGLGFQNRDIAKHLPIKRWLIPSHPHMRNLSPVDRVSMSVCNRDLSDDEILRWLIGLDWILFVETPHDDRITSLAKAVGVRVAAVCNWEWTCLLESQWLPDVDLMICPTRHTWRLMSDWQTRFFPAWKLLHVPWPIDGERFAFQPRRRCRRFVFINGMGGVQARRPNGTLTPYHRKGIEVLFQAARLADDVSILVYSQTDTVPNVPPNVTLCKPPTDNRTLYTDADVCVQPSHWEGLGLQLLECQAAGLPLITSSAAPMNEYQPMRSIPISRTEVVHLAGKTPVTSCLMDPRELATILREVNGSEIEHHSYQARKFVEQQHEWSTARQQILQAMND